MNEIIGGIIVVCMYLSLIATGAVFTIWLSVGPMGGSTGKLRK